MNTGEINKLNHNVKQKKIALFFSAESQEHCLLISISDHFLYLFSSKILLQISCSDIPEMPYFLLPVQGTTDTDDMVVSHHVGA